VIGSGRLGVRERLVMSLSLLLDQLVASSASPRLTGFKVYLAFVTLGKDVGSGRRSRRHAWNIKLPSSIMRFNSDKLVFLSISDTYGQNSS